LTGELAIGDGPGMTAETQTYETGAPSLVDSLEEYLVAIPRAERPDALHQVFYGFYTRVAVIDRTTYELAEWAKLEVPAIDDVPASLAEAMRDNSLLVGQELFASRMRAMSAMGYIAKRLTSLLNGAPPTRPYTLTHAVAFDQERGEMRSYDLSAPGEHPELPYDPTEYDPHQESPPAG
jgi:hypothetical protein